MNRVFNGWYNCSLSSKLEHQMSSPQWKSTFSISETEEDYIRIAQSYCDQTLLTKAFVSLKQYANFKKSQKKQPPPEEDAALIQKKELEFTKQRLMKYLEVHNELQKYRIWKALQVNVQKSKIRKGFIDQRCEVFISKHNKMLATFAIQALKSHNEESTREYLVKLNKVGEQNYWRIVSQTFTEWSRITKKLKFTKSVSQSIIASRSLDNKTKMYQAWRRAFKLRLLARSFPIYWRRKMAFRAFRKYREHKQIKHLLYIKCTQHREKTILRQYSNIWKEYVKEEKYTRHLKLTKLSQMDVFKKKQVLTTWKKFNSDKRMYKQLLQKADSHHSLVMLKAFRRGWAISKSDEIRRKQDGLKRLAQLRKINQLTRTRQIFEAWNEVVDHQREFNHKLNRVLMFRARNIYKIVYSKWARLTKKREKYRKKNQMAILFYLKNTYRKVFLGGLKPYTDMNIKSKNFAHRKVVRVALEWFENWKKQYIWLNVIHHIDFLSNKRKKQKWFAILLEYAKTERFHRDVHNTIVINHLMGLKLKAFQAFKKNIKERREARKQYEMAEEHYSNSIAQRQFSKLKRAANVSLYS